MAGAISGTEQQMDCTDTYKLALGQDKYPDCWQRQFAVDDWPEALIAPTGSGKTAAVTLGWVAHRMRAPETTPRRLVWCLPMRTLVEQTADEVKRWLGRLHGRDLAEGILPTPGDVHVLMGGIEAARWLHHPERPAIIIGTQDMLLSRALMRGYASSRAIWPMEFALLHEDTQWVFDEVQLMGTGRATSAQLEAFRRCEAERAAHERQPRRCPARSLWISATLEPRWLRTVDFQAPTGDAIRRVDPQKEHDARLWQLATAKKTLNRATCMPASSKSEDINNYIDELAREVLVAHRPGHMTLVIVNRVRRAQDLYTALTKALKQKPGNAPELALVHSRFRPADRQREMDKVVAKDKNEDPRDLIVVATQAVEAGLDISAAVMFTELASWPSTVQRFGRANRYAEWKDGADVRWIDLLAEVADHKAAEILSLPYSPNDMKATRERLQMLTDVAPATLPAPGDIDPPRRVIRRKDLDDLFDTDPDLTGFDVDISPYVRDADDTDVRIFWRDLSIAGDTPLRPRAEELCAVSIGSANDWLKKMRKQGRAQVFVLDPQWRRGDERTVATPPNWTRLTHEQGLRPGLTLLADVTAGGYCEDSGFTGIQKDAPSPIREAGEPSIETAEPPDPDAGGEAEGHDEDPWSEIGVPVLLSVHLGHVAAEAEALCDALVVDSDTRVAVVRAARWHDVGKAHDVFQSTMRRGLGDREVEVDLPLAKTVKRSRHERAFFRHELASALALLAHEEWSRNADLIAYLVAAHHGKVRMNLRALPREQPPSNSDRAGVRFARGVWEDDELMSVALGGGEQWAGGRLTLSVMELGWDETTRESWTERTRDLLARFGPFRLAWMETIVRLADWRASAKERKGYYGDV